eukprot:1352681-Amphidinium_carterae.1
MDGKTVWVNWDVAGAQRWVSIAVVASGLCAASGGKLHVVNSESEESDVVKEQTHGREDNDDPEITDCELMVIAVVIVDAVEFLHLSYHLMQWEFVVREVNVELCMSNIEKVAPSK